MHQLPVPVHASTVAPCGAIFTAYYNEVSVSRDGGETFEKLASVDNPQRIGATLLTFDSAGGLYFSTRELGKLFLSRDDGRTFLPVCEGFDGSIRGFDEDATGRRYAGVYSRQGPARLLASNDGERFETIHEWDARHIHDVRVNPENDWLYVNVGEGTPRRTAESHSVYRSTDRGRTFTRVLAPVPRGRPRPLYLPLNFDRSRVLLGTDHTEGHNAIHAFVDSGEAREHETEVLFSFPEQRFRSTIEPHVCFLEWLGPTLFAGFRGRHFSALVKSDDLRTFELVHATSADNVAIRAYLSASRRANHDVLVVGSTPGLLLRRHSSQPAPGLAITAAHEDGSDVER